MSMLNINATPSMSAPDGPFCEACGGRTRLVGIEAHPRLLRTDLRTYECGGCDATHVVAAPQPSASVNALIVVNPQA
jgi:hypothetical protein